jgi:hypothetical protein
MKMVKNYPRSGCLGCTNMKYYSIKKPSPENIMPMSLKG